MKTVMLMFDTLRRDVLPCYDGLMELENFKRLEDECSIFDHFYSSSLPCMPARRELQTGYPNFLHRGWSPLEPYDPSFVEELKKEGVYTHLITDHQHYWEDGGATYHNRFNSYEFVRGQEGDLFKPALNVGGEITDLDKYIQAAPGRQKMIRHDETNKKYIESESDYPQVQCINLGVEFLEQNHDFDNWFLQLECFDPHEPFNVPDRFKDMIDPELKNEVFDWPLYINTRNIDDLRKIDVWNKNYKALLLMIDENLGRILDVFDKYNLWEDTAIMLNTDHGFMFGEKEWSGKAVMPVYDEVCHTPFLMHIPGQKLTQKRYDNICQTYDIAPTIYDLYELETHPETFGSSILKIIDGSVKREFGYCGYFGGHLNVFNHDYTYMRGSVTIDNSPLKEYTLMPMRMRNMFTKDDFKNIKLVDGFDYFKDWKVLEVDSNLQFYNPFVTGHLLFDRNKDPKQETPIDNKQVESEFAANAYNFLKEMDAPKSQYERLGLSSDFDIEQDRAKREKVLKDQFGNLDYNEQSDNIKHTLVDMANNGYQQVIEKLENRSTQLDLQELYDIKKQYFPNDEVLQNFIERKY